jgi:hypothetical protein
VSGQELISIIPLAVFFLFSPFVLGDSLHCTLEALDDDVHDAGTSSAL